MHLFVHNSPPFRACYGNESNETLDCIKQVNEELQANSAALDAGNVHVCAALNNTYGSERMIQQLFHAGHAKELEKAGIFKKNRVKQPQYNVAKSELKKEMAAGNALPPMLQAVKRYVTRTKLLRDLDDLRSTWVYTWNATRRIYRPENNAKYPFLYSDGAPLDIIGIPYQEKRGESGNIYKSSDAFKFVDSTLLPRTRGKLYDTMRRTVFSKSHRKCKDEACMVEGKENTVEATCDIAEGSCLGAYGGFGLTGEDFGAPMDDNIEPDKGYIMRAAKTCGQETREAEEDDTKVAEIDGNNILSLINTIFEWKKGIPYAQAKLGYNVEFVGFRGILKDGSEVNLTFVFAKCNIKAGEELRVNYHYTKKTIADIFAFPRGKRANAEPNIEIEEVESGDDESALVARFAACEVEER